MVNLKLLEKRGITQASLKAKLEIKAFEGEMSNEQKTESEKLANFRQRLRLRIQNGRESNISNYKTYYALDQAWDVPFKQTSMTLLQSLLDKNPDDSTVHSCIKAWGFDINDVIVEVEDPKTKKKSKKLNIPNFFIHVPIVKAYVTMRLAKIMNDRRLLPFLKYEPVIDNTVSRLRGQTMTSRGETITQQYGLFNVVKQAVFQMLHYSYCLLFPVEEWHRELQEVGDEEEGTIDPDSTSDPKKKVRIVREGIRHHAPHPSRTFKDDAHRLSTYNTDTGCEYGGYWRVLRYRDIRNNPKFWNRDKVSIGATDWWTSVSSVAFFNTVYNGCVMKGAPTSGSTGDRETKMVDQFYSSTMDDQPVVFTEYFEKLIPSECGLGDYDYPVWFRFVVASDDTILYAAPLPYSPIIYFGYDADEARAENASMSLECLPFQDHFTHLMTQFLLSVKQNLANAVFVDTDVVGKEWIDTIRNWGEKVWRVINFIPFSGRKALKSQQGVPQAFFSHKFQLHDTESLIRAMNIVLDTLERVLVMSSQEVAQTASHEQTREEIRNISANTSTRLVHTATPVDHAIEALKRQLYEGVMAYGEEEFWAQIPLDHLLAPSAMEELGFTVADNLMSAKDRKVTVKVKKTAIAYETFTSRRDGSDRINNTEGGVAMLTFLMQLVASPVYELIGSEQIIQLINLSSQLIGFPREFRLENMNGDESPEKAKERQQEELKLILNEIRQAILPEVQQGLVPIMENQKQLQAELDQMSLQNGQLKLAIDRISMMANGAPMLPPTNDTIPPNSTQPRATFAPSPMA